MRLVCLIVVGTLSILFVTGCMGNPRITDPKRTAVEQLLLSTAADRALANIDLSVLSGRKVFPDNSNFEGEDKGYITGLVLHLLGEHDVLVVRKVEEADVVLEIVSGAFSNDRSDSLIGIPEFGIPIPLAGSFNTPEIALFKTVMQIGVAKFALNAYEISTGKQLLATGPVDGKSHYTFRTVFFFFKFRTSDIPEKAKGWWNQP
ncbi:MAG: DUF6655 family protein [Candidatus Loosdrechtia sp.]|uniref:DUF6655 family protein n=1 Tax=Candidatus Loosdrechtia sp. TaxID=3101272 RepID=UPI003A6FDC09|nr:MAG: hypothetical protein QY305_05270 [Candidatus Jettenia sp. AMX2]